MLLKDTRHSGPGPPRPATISVKQPKMIGLGILVVEVLLILSPFLLVWLVWLIPYFSPMVWRMVE